MESSTILNAQAVKMDLRRQRSYSTIFNKIEADKSGMQFGLDLPSAELVDDSPPGGEEQAHDGKYIEQIFLGAKVIIIALVWALAEELSRERQAWRKIIIQRSHRQCIRVKWASRLQWIEAMTSRWMRTNLVIETNNAYPIPRGASIQSCTFGCTSKGFISVFVHWLRRDLCLLLGTHKAAEFPHHEMKVEGHE